MLRVKNAVINLLTILLSLILLLLIGELSLRLFYYYKYNINILNNANQGLMSKDKEKGWKMSENLSYEIKEKDALNNIYHVHIKTNKYGFRLFGNPQSSKVKLFFIGDSFTAAMNVSNDKTFYGIIKNTIKEVDVFAYGAGGYGSLQEYMVINDFIDTVKPNVIVWQFYKNDYLDNDYKLDILKSFYNTGIPRPYLDLNGKITYRYAKYDNLFFALPALVSENIRLLRFLNTELSKILNKISKKETSFEDIARLPITREELKRSAQITTMIMQMVKKRVGTIPVCLFCITEEQPYYDTIKNICQSVGIHFIDTIPHNLNKYERENPFSTKAADKEHLNEFGNRIVAEAIIQFLKENRFIQ
jgi:hypothetical protein